jgi:DNA repair protein RecN (Recombination protein N)
MLQKLTIENYVLIDHLEIDFREGLSVITGETGAGKSILLGALSLIVGQRADTGVLWDPLRKCIVEGIFRIRDYSLEGFFKDNELDYDDSAILRREIGQNGKSRAFINDTPVNLSLLKELGDKLVNIHSQHDIVTLNETNFQLAVLDNYAKAGEDVQKYRGRYSAYLQSARELDELISQEIKSRQEKDYTQFLFDELNVSAFKEGEQEEIEQRLEMLSHAEEIKTNLYNASQTLSTDEGSILSQLSDLTGTIRHLSKYHPHLNDIAERLVSDQIDLKDILNELDRIGQETSFDPEEAENLTSRLDLIYRLEKKHAVTSVTELIQIHNGLEKKLLDVITLDEKITVLKNTLSLESQELAALAEKISVKRKKGIPAIEKSIVALLVKLGMPDARFRIDHTTLSQPGRDGIDRVKFLFSSNKGVDLDEIQKIASGGELSRLMLSIKSLISQKNLLPTIIFDEIDSGVSGEIAGKVGDILRKMAGTMQVIVITHLPQIAGKGDLHYLVYKVNEKSIARTYMKLLSREERILEIAKMLSNEKVTDAAYATARELLLNE